MRHQELPAEDGGLAARIPRVAPRDLRQAGATLPPDATPEGGRGRPRPVTSDELDRRLRTLVGWSGDTDGIQRTVELSVERLDLVLDRVREAERALGHRTRVIARTPTLLTLRARTESLAAVTEEDLVLAGRVDDAVASVGSGG